jgi:hypothetical protein
MGLNSGCVVELERLTQQHRKGVESAVQNYSDVISLETSGSMILGSRSFLVAARLEMTLRTCSAGRFLWVPDIVKAISSKLDKAGRAPAELQLLRATRAEIM